MPINTSATTSPRYVYDTSIPIFDRGFPINPVVEYILDNVIPATAVGSVNGISISPSIILFPGKSYLTRTQASIVPKITFIKAAINAEVILVLNAYSTLELVTISQNSEGLSLNEYTRTEARGISIMIDSIAIVMPNVIPKPGITLFPFLRNQFISTPYLSYISSNMAPSLK